MQKQYAINLRTIYIYYNIFTSTCCDHLVAWSMCNIKLLASSPDYKSREKGCATKMLNDLDIPSLQIRRKESRLAMMFNVVNELFPVLPPSKLPLASQTEKESQDSNSFIGQQS